MGCFLNNLSLCVWSFFLYAFTATILYPEFPSLFITSHCSYTISQFLVHLWMQEFNLHWTTMESIHFIYTPTAIMIVHLCLLVKQKAHYSLRMVLSRKSLFTQSERGHESEGDAAEGLFVTVPSPWPSKLPSKFNNLWTSFVCLIASKPKYFIWLDPRGSLGKQIRGNVPFRIKTNIC